jgi:hypothetical protein
VAQVYELFDGSGPGVYWFWCTSLGKWVIADLDTGRAYHVESFARIDLAPASEGRDRIDVMRTGVLGVVGDRALVEREEAIVFFRDHATDVRPDTFVMYEGGGRMSAGNRAYATIKDVSGIIGKIRQKRRGKEID